jgi:thioredoxin reductase (NADPH)
MKYERYDLAVLGCGPAGLSAAINATIRNKKVIVIGSDICSPPLYKAQKINNYLGIPESSGEELLQKFMDHAVMMNVEIINTKATVISEADEGFSILVGDDVVSARALIIATGVPYRATLPQEELFLGKGLGYCATCDGPIYQNKDVLIIAHSDEAESEAKFMAEICRKVYYLPLYQGAVGLDQKIEIINAKPAAIVGREYVEGLELKDGSIIKAEGIFVLGGETAPDRLVPGLEIINNHIPVNRNQETNLPGVFAAGDCTGPPYQVAKSIGEGQVAGLNASKYLTKLKNV